MFGGGMGVKTFYLNCRRQGFKVTEEECAQLRKAWFDLYVEMNRYIQPPKDGVIPAAVLEGRKNMEEEENDLEALETDMESGYTIDDNGKLRKTESGMVQLYWNETFLKQHRARATYSAACNFPFQAAASTVSKHMLWLVYLDSLKNGSTRLIHTH